MKKICHLVNHVLEGLIVRFAFEIIGFIFSPHGRKDSPNVADKNHRENGRRSSSRSKSHKKRSRFDVHLI
jgi:hypothetical protein